MQTCKIKIQNVIFELRASGNAPAFYMRCIDSIIQPLPKGPVFGRGFFMPFLQGLGPDLHSRCDSRLKCDKRPPMWQLLFMRPKFSGLKIWTFISASRKIAAGSSPF